MELNRPVTVFLSESGKEALELAAGVSRLSVFTSFYGFHTDESGLWVSVRKDDGEHLLLLRWDCILAVDVPLGGTPIMETSA
jgi:hypothetical protein